MGQVIEVRKLRLEWDFNPRPLGHLAVAFLPFLVGWFLPKTVDGHEQISQLFYFHSIVTWALLMLIMSLQFCAPYFQKLDQVLGSNTEYTKSKSMRNKQGARKDFRNPMIVLFKKNLLKTFEFQIQTIIKTYSSRFWNSSLSIFQHFIKVK